MTKRFKKPSVVILGASGGVGQAVLGILKMYRFLFDNVVLIDRNDSLLSSASINHSALNYIFIKKDFTGEIKKVLNGVKKEFNVSIVLDLTDSETLPILKASDSLGLNYLNCSLNYESSSMLSFVEDFKRFSQTYSKAKHVLSLGMNPGVIDHLIIKGVLEYGSPNEFIEIEFDSGRPSGEIKKPFITWSKKQFLNEVVRDPSGFCGPEGKYLELSKPAVSNLIDTKSLLEPLIKLRRYPKGMIVPHDEVISMARVLEVPGKFIYAIHPSSLSLLSKLYNRKKNIVDTDVDFIDNVSKPLSGSDCVGVWLIYNDKKVCYYTEIEHGDVSGTNATLHLVAVGVIAGLVDFVGNFALEKGVRSAIELDNKTFLQIVSNHVNIKKVVI